MKDHTIASSEGVIIAEVSHHELNGSVSPYDTGARLEPHPWVHDGTKGSEYQRPADPDDYGRVDFDDDEGTTIATVHIEGSADAPEEVFVMKIAANAPIIIYGPDGAVIGIVTPS